MKIFGIRVKQELKEKNITQSKMAKDLNVQKTTLCEWLNGNNEPPMETIAKIAIYLEVSTDYLLGIENEDGTKIIKNSFNNFKNEETIKS